MNKYVTVKSNINNDQDDEIYNINIDFNDFYNIEHPAILDKLNYEKNKFMSDCNVLYDDKSIDKLKLILITVLELFRMPTHLIKLSLNIPTIEELRNNFPERCLEQKIVVEYGIEIFMINTQKLFYENINLKSELEEAKSDLYDYRYSEGMDE